MKQFDPNLPYNELAALPPSKEIETREILKLCIKARTALAELKQTAIILPNQDVLINTLPILEAQTSSEIENIITTTDKLFQVADHEPRNLDPATKEALRYRSALFEGFQSLQQRPITTATTEAICSRLKGVDMSIRKTPGTTLQNDLTGEIIYTPPTGETLLREKLSNWEKFIHGDEDLDPLIKMAIMHYQFEAIHPFTDGNGRTGRIINILFLIEQNLLEIPILYLSRYIIHNKKKYYDLLLKVTQNQEWLEWVKFMLNAVYETAVWTKNKITAILQLLDTTREYIRKEAPKIYTAELVEVLFNQPYCRISNLEEANIAKRQTASEYLKYLSEIGILREKKIGREKLFINERYLKLLITEPNAFTPFPQANL